MKKRMLWMLCIGMLLSMAGCAVSPQTDGGNAVALRAIETDYLAAVSYYEETATWVLTLSEKDTGTEIQGITLPEYDGFTQQPAYAVDLDFDGNEDLLVPAARAAGGVYFHGYRWDPADKQLMHLPTMRELPNIALDAANTCLLSHRSGNQITAYGIYRYVEDSRDVVGQNSLYWEPAANEGHNAVKEEKLENGSWVVVNSGTVAAPDAYALDESDPLVAGYFAAGSLWDLHSNRWTDHPYTLATE